MLVELTQGYTAEIDFSDWWKVKDYSWFAHVRSHTVYACSSWPKGHTTYMHSLIRPAPPGLWVDHIDGNGLHNRWNNLRHATPKQSNANAYRVQNATGYVGVSETPAGMWRARARKGGVRFHIGVFDTAEEAARAHDAWTLAEYGEFAVLNFPMGY